MRLINIHFPHTPVREIDGRYVYTVADTGATARIPSTASQTALETVGLFQRVDNPPAHDPARQRVVPTGSWPLGVREYQVIDLTIEEVLEAKITQAKRSAQILSTSPIYLNGVQVNTDSDTKAKLDAAAARLGAKTIRYHVKLEDGTVTWEDIDAATASAMADAIMDNEIAIAAALEAKITEIQTAAGSGDLATLAAVAAEVTL